MTFPIFVPLVVGFGHMAKTGTQIGGFQPTIVFYAFMALYVALLLFAFISFAMASIRVHHVVVTESYISAPKSIFKRKPTIVRFSDVKSVKCKYVRAIERLEIQHVGGRLTINGSMLPEHALATLYAELTRRLGLKPAAQPSVTDGKPA